MRRCADLHARSVHVIWLLTTLVTDGRKFEQMRLYADFNAGPSKEKPLFFLFILIVLFGRSLAGQANSDVDCLVI